LGKAVSTAKVRFAHVSARKTRDLADLIRGLTVAEAREQLAAVHRPSAMPTVIGALSSAVANYEDKVREDAIENQGKADALLVGEVLVDGGPMVKRFQPRAMGRACTIRKRTCHLMIKLYTQV
jgi:large subunit ribosomal protein L22